MNQTGTYVGRFAPSPTGPLHFGSLIAAVGSYLDAKAHGGKWLLRMEDLDTPRNMPGAADDILRTLEAFGFEWDGEVAYQSARKNLYQDALENLSAQNLIYPCACSRKEIADSSIIGIEGPVYPGTCRDGMRDGCGVRAWRLRTNKKFIIINDLHQYSFSQNIAAEVGDFVVQRADRIFTYQLSVVVDDAAQDITHVVRGADLLASTPRQVYLQQLLDLPTPQYLHLPLALNERGEKLSKQTLAGSLDSSNPAATLHAALNFLGQPLPDHALSQSALWDWAKANWSRESIPHLSILLPTIRSLS
jgi:glutamyl-Q tRNA(Asp) synthetase